jgi:hypothetical protein
MTQYTSYLRIKVQRKYIMVRGPQNIKHVLLFTLYRTGDSFHSGFSKNQLQRPLQFTVLHANPLNIS